MRIKIRKNKNNSPNYDLVVVAAKILEKFE